MFKNIFDFFAYKSNYFYFLIIGALFLFSIILLNLYKIQKAKKGRESKIENKRLLYFFVFLLVSFFTQIKREDVYFILGGISNIVLLYLIVNFPLDLINKKVYSNYLKEKAKENIPFSVFKGEEKKVSKIIVREQEEKKPNDYQINFSHIKTILDKVEHISLTIEEKRQVADLRLMLSQVEKGENNDKNLSEINDGLNSLLKIMSKYAI